ncbi:MAG: carboxypeptidase-like regulatory domain-containing protein, partial [Solirubrobacteraceae bacterium]
MRGVAASLAVAALLSALALTCGPTAPALAATTGAISGSVTSGVTGAALLSAGVVVYDSGGNFVASASSDHNGAYQVAGLAPGSYQVQFTDSGYLTQYYDNSSSSSSAT